MSKQRKAEQKNKQRRTEAHLKVVKRRQKVRSQRAVEQELAQIRAGLEPRVVPIRNNYE